MPSHLDDRVDGTVRVLIVSGTVCNSLLSLFWVLEVCFLVGFFCLFVCLFS